MSRDNKKVKILLSSQRMQELFKYFRVGDRTIVTVEKRLGRGKYIIELRGVKLIAIFDGVLERNKKLYAVFHSLSPQVVLKLTSPADFISTKCKLLKDRVSSVSDFVSIQPFIADVMQNIFILIDRYKAFLPSSKKKESLNLIHEQMEKQVINLNHTLSEDINIQDILKNIISPEESLNQCLQVLRDRSNETSSSVFAQRLDAFFELKQEFEDLMLHFLLVQEINKMDIKKKGYRYYQIPVYFENRYGTVEVFIKRSKAINVYDADVWFHHIGVDYLKISINKNKKIIGIKKIHDVRNKGRIRKFVFFLRGRLKELEWFINEDEHVFNRANGHSPLLYKPVVFDIKMPQHFTMVA